MAMSGQGKQSTMSFNLAFLLLGPSFCPNHIGVFPSTFWSVQCAQLAVMWVSGHRGIARLRIEGGG
jgi:hypothetical protein